jgi:hypothetical protein
MVFIIFHFFLLLKVLHWKPNPRGSFALKHSVLARNRSEMSFRSRSQVVCDEMQAFAFAFRQKFVVEHKKIPNDLLLLLPSPSTFQHPKGGEHKIINPINLIFSYNFFFLALPLLVDEIKN